MLDINIYIDAKKKPKCRHKLKMTVGPVSNRDITLKKENPMALVLTDIQKVSLSIAAVDAAGNPSTVEDVVWNSSANDILTITADPTDPSKAVATTTGKLGTAQIQVSADAKIGEGTVALNGIQDVEVVAGEAVSLNIAAGTPESRV